MRNTDCSKCLPGRLRACAVVGVLGAALAVIAGCSPPQPPPLGPGQPQPDGHTDAAPPPSKPVIVITAAGPQLNGDSLPLAAIVARVREYIRSTDEPGTTKVLTVTIQPDVRIKDENEARATLGQLEQGPDRCTVLLETPPAPGGRFPSRGD